MPWYNLFADIRRLKQQMSALSDAVAKAATHLTALEQRVTDHEARDEANRATLQKQIDDLTNAGADPVSIQALNDLADNMDTFDPIPTPPVGGTP